MRYLKRYMEQVKFNKNKTKDLLAPYYANVEAFNDNNDVEYTDWSYIRYVLNFPTAGTYNYGVYGYRLTLLKAANQVIKLKSMGLNNLQQHQDINSMKVYMKLNCIFHIISIQSHNSYLVKIPHI